MKKQTLFSLTLVLICLLFILLASIFSSDVNNSLTSGSECKLTEQTCRFVDELGNIRIDFSQPPVIEEELSVDIILSEGLILNNAWIEGVNMYMGKTLVIPKNVKGYSVSDSKINATNRFQGITFLGSCTEPSMNWVMFLEVTSRQKNESKTYQIFFSTNAQ